MHIFLKRIQQIFKYGWQQSKTLAADSKKGRLSIFFDMLCCFSQYKMWTNQYAKETFHLKTKEERQIIGQNYLKAGKERDQWQKDFVENRKFLNRYSQKKYELPRLREKRNEAYRKRYNMGKNCLVEYGVELSRQHYLFGAIRIGNNVLLAKNVFIDYSGNVEIKDNVQITNGVVIESHHHAFHSDYKQSRNIIIPANITIEEGTVIGTRAIILPSCSYIGKNARVGAGAVVTKDVPDGTTVAGIPAKIIKQVAF